MNELFDLQLEPLVYFLTHSTLFVVIMGCAFFLLGLSFGALTWRRFKLGFQRCTAENESLQQEIGVLKRRLTETTLKAAATPAPEETAPQPGPSAPAPQEPSILPPVFVTAPPLPQTETTLAPAPAPAPVPASAPVPSLLPEVANLPIVSALFSSTLPMTAANGRHSAAPIIPAPRQLPAEAEPSTAIEPFSFLMEPEAEKENLTAASSPSAQPESEASLTPSAPASEDAKPSETAAAASPLSGILAAPIRTESPEGSATLSSAYIPQLPSVIPEEDATLGWVYREPPEDVDDLTRIKGVTSAFQTRLNQLGVYTFHQISQWQEKQIKAFSSRLAFKDRIDRESWVEQARDLDSLRLF